MGNYFSGLKFLWGGRGTGLRYHVNPMSGRKELRVSGEPCNKPPWGSLVAVDLAKGEIRWSVRTLGAVFRTALFAVFDALGVQNTA